jgi:hypothetical protein
MILILCRFPASKTRETLATQNIEIEFLARFLHFGIIAVIFGNATYQPTTDCGILKCITFPKIRETLQFQFCEKESSGCKIAPR